MIRSSESHLLAVLYYHQHQPPGNNQPWAHLPITLGIKNWYYENVIDATLGIWNLPITLGIISEVMNWFYNWKLLWCYELVFLLEISMMLWTGFIIEISVMLWTGYMKNLITAFKYKWIKCVKVGDHNTLWIITLEIIWCKAKFINYWHVLIFGNNYMYIICKVNFWCYLVSADWYWWKPKVIPCCRIHITF